MTSEIEFKHFPYLPDVYLNENECALHPNWSNFDRLNSYLKEHKIKWRTDPAFHCVIVDDWKLAETLEKQFDCKNRTETIREVLDKKEGAWIAGYHKLNGMLIYNIEHDYFVRVNENFKGDIVPIPLLAYEVSVRFGLGESLPEGVTNHHQSVADAIEAVKPHMIKAQDKWLNKQEKWLVNHGANRNPSLGSF